jgi:hypothetical protein
MRELLVYSRTGCHLCEFLLDEIRPLCEEAGVALRVLDVDSSEAWRERYGLRVPVVCDGEAEVSEWPLDRARLRAWLGPAHAGHSRE